MIIRSGLGQAIFMLLVFFIQFFLIDCTLWWNNINWFDFSGERAMSPAQSEDSGLAAERGTTYATISLPRENAPAMGIVFLGKSFNQQSISFPTYKLVSNKRIWKKGFGRIFPMFSSTKTYHIIFFVNWRWICSSQLHFLHDDPPLKTRLDS